MGVQSAKKSPSKDARSPVATRNSTSKAIKAQSMRTPETPSRSSRGRNTPREGYTHHLPTASERRNNGRVTGRSLIVWGRPRMAEKLLLHLQYECARHKVGIPWDAIAHRLHPGSSGAAIMQHLNRLRKELITEGHLVPPVPQRPGHSETLSAEIRGYIREDMDGDDLHTTRPVRFDEDVEDRRFNLPSVFNLEEACEEEGQEDWPTSPTPMSHSQSRSTHHRMNSVEQRSVKSSRPSSSLSMAQSQGQIQQDNDILQALLTHQEDASPTDSISPDEAPGSELDCFTSPSVRRQRKQSSHGTPVAMVNPYHFSYPQVALPHQAMGAEYRAMANPAANKTSPGRQQGFYDANIAPWAMDGATEHQQQQPMMHPYGFSLPSSYPPIHYPSPSPAHAVAPVTQHSSQGAQHSFSSMSSGADTQPSEANADVDSQGKCMMTDEGKVDNLFTS